MNKQRVVIALGGNAVQAHDGTAEAQQKAIDNAASLLSAIIKDGYQVAITHGNGPQVGSILLQQLKANSKETPAMPLDTCGAMSQGMIGYWLEKGLAAQLRKHKIVKDIASIVTRVEVDAHDLAFKKPGKPIGPFYSKQEAKKFMEESDVVYKEDAGRGWRRVVPSPKPINILEHQSIKTLLENDHVVISAGGGGVPIYNENKNTIGIEGVIDKDFASQKLAELIDADTLLILTEVEMAYIHFNESNQQALGEITVCDIQNYIDEGHFAPGSMLPKVEAAAAFAESNPEGKAIIASLDRAYDALLGKTGTIIKKEHPLAESNKSHFA